MHITSYYKLAAETKHDSILLGGETVKRWTERTRTVGKLSRSILTRTAVVAAAPSDLKP